MTDLEKAIIKAIDEGLGAAGERFGTWSVPLDAGDWEAKDFVVNVDGRIDLADMARRVSDAVAGSVMLAQRMVLDPIDVVAVHEKHIRGLAVTYGLDVDEESIAAAHAVTNEMGPVESPSLQPPAIASAMIHARLNDIEDAAKKCDSIYGVRILQVIEDFRGELRRTSS